MSTTPFRVFGIEWEALTDAPPSEVIVNLPDWLVSLGYEDFEAEGTTDNFNDEDWDEYEPSDEAHDALCAEWKEVILSILLSTYKINARAFQGYSPQ